MPNIAQSSYQPKGVLKSGHLQTIFPTLFRSINTSKVQPQLYRHQYLRERLELDDGDFLDLDWTLAKGRGNTEGQGTDDQHVSRETNNTTKLVILCHGLESSTDATYMRCMAKTCQLNGWDSVGYNFRGCSGEPNRLARAYHCGLTGDLEHVVQHALQKGRYQTIALVGFSLGGNLVLKYMGERGENVVPQIISSAAVSVPCDLADSSIQLEHWDNWIYKTRFLRLLVSKSELKGHLKYMDEVLMDGMARNIDENFEKAR